jgi:hypothetical protein
VDKEIIIESGPAPDIPENVFGGGGEQGVRGTAQSSASIKTMTENNNAKTYKDTTTA